MGPGHLGNIDEAGWPPHRSESIFKSTTPLGCAPSLAPPQSFVFSTPHWSPELRSEASLDVTDCVARSPGSFRLPSHATHKARALCTATPAVVFEDLILGSVCLGRSDRELESWV